MLKNISKINRFIIYLTIFLVPFYFFRFSLLGIKTNIFEAGVLISFALEIIVIAKSSKRLKQSDEKRHGILPRDDGNVVFGIKNWLLPIILLITALFGILVASDTTKALGIFKGWFLAPIILAWVIAKNLNKRNLYKISAPIFISLLLISSWAILQKIGLIGAQFYQVGDTSFNQYILEGRVFGPFESPNYLAMFIVPAVFLSLPVVEFFKNRSIKAAALILFSLPLAALYLSASRAGIITAVAGILIFLVHALLSIQKIKSRPLFYTGIFVFFFALLNIGYLFFSTNNYNPAGGGDKIRVEIYEYSGTLVKNNAIFGTGLGGFKDRVSEISINNPSFQLYAVPYALHPHNLFLAVWLNLGIAGLIIFILILVSLFKRLFTSDSSFRPYFIAAAAAVLIHGLFDTTYFKNDLSAIFWLIYSGAVILTNPNEKKTFRKINFLFLLVVIIFIPFQGLFQNFLEFNTELSTGSIFLAGTLVRTVIGRGYGVGGGGVFLNRKIIDTISLKLSLGSY